MSNIGQKESRQSTKPATSVKYNVVISNELDAKIASTMGKLDATKSQVVRDALEAYCAAQLGQ